MSWQGRYLARFYFGRAGWRDGTQEFHDLIGRMVPRRSRIMEIGAGGGNPTSAFLARLGSVHGIDPDPAVLSNPDLTSAAVMTGERFPFEDRSFDACVSNYVVEHVSDPVLHLAEVARVLVPGGTYLFRTPNRFHYVALASSLTPHWLHEHLAARLRGLPAEEHVHRTFYRLNTAAAIRRASFRAGLQVEDIRMVEKEPSYGLGSRILFIAFMGYERLVNSLPALAPVRANIFAVLRKAD